MKKSEIIESFWESDYFEQYQKPKDIALKIWKDYKIDAGNIIMTLKSKRYLKKFPKGWKQIRPSKRKIIIQTDEMEEISSILRPSLEREIFELKIAFIHQPDCTAFLLRKILEKLLFIILSKSNKKQKIVESKKKDKLPNLTELLNLAKSAEIENVHILSPKNIVKLNGSKFLGDVSAHDYLTNVSFEDIKQEISVWRISIKELAKNL